MRNGTMKINFKIPEYVGADKKNNQIFFFYKSALNYKNKIVYLSAF